MKTFCIQDVSFGRAVDKMCFPMFCSDIVKLRSLSAIRVVTKKLVLTS